MTNKALAVDYIKRAKIRLNILKEYFNLEDFADVVREAQEIVELVQKAILIQYGIDPPKWHDVIDILIEHQEKLPSNARTLLKELRKDTKWLRTQREIAFYGDKDFIPINEYNRADAERALALATQYLDLWGVIE